MSTRLERKEVFFQGHVQGVGFRYTTRSIAAGFDVTGFVRNLPDGRVQLVAEGSSQQVAGFLEEIKSRMGHYIHDISVAGADATGEYSRFDIAF